MSRTGATESTPFSDNPRLEYVTIQRDTGGNREDGIQLDQETIEETQRKLARNQRELGWAMALYPAVIITWRLLTNAWSSWCVVMVIVLAAQTGAQDLEDMEVSSVPPNQVLSGMDISHGSYR